MKRAAALAAMAALAVAASPARAADLSPANWPPALRADLETRDAFPFPAYPGLVQGDRELVAGTTSRAAVHAGMQALAQGGTAADAAIAVALTQIATNLGAVVSYAGVAQILYFDARTGKVYALDASWNSYAGETDPATIPNTDISLITGQPAPAGAGYGALGRQTLAPGFMAGIEALHARFGRLPFADLFQPAIWYADNGVSLSAGQANSFKMRQGPFWRTPEGHAFASMPDGSLPKAEDLYKQPELARTLRAVAAHGTAYMYTGDWARAFVAAVDAAGGKATLADLAGYKPTWRQPLSLNFQGATLYAPGEDASGACPVLEALNLLGGAHIETLGPYWRDPKAFTAYDRALKFAQYAHYAPQMAAAERSFGFTPDCTSRITPAYAAKFSGLTLAPLATLTGGQVAAPADAPPPPTPHTNAVVVVDRWGDVAVVVHSINTLIWGDTGIVVGGIPIPDAAAINKYALTKLKPGGRVPSQMTPVIALRDGKPVLAVGTVGSDLVPETTRIVASLLTGAGDLQTVMAAPTLLNTVAPPPKSLWLWPAVVPGGAYDAAMVQALAAQGLTIEERSKQQTQAIRGTAVVALIDQPSGAPRAIELPTQFGVAETDRQLGAATPKAIAIAPDTLDRYVGDYQITPALVAHIARDGDRLFAKSPGRPRLQLFPDAENHFFETADAVGLTFHLGVDGKATEMVVVRDGATSVAPRVGVGGEPPRLLRLGGRPGPWR